MIPGELEKRPYRLTDYVRQRDLGTAQAPTATLQAVFKALLLIEAVLQGDAQEGGDCQVKGQPVSVQIAGFRAVENENQGGKK